MASITQGEQARRDEVVGDEVRKEGHAAIEILYSWFIRKPLNVLKQESKTA